MSASTEPIEVSYRVEGGVWSDQAVAEPAPPPPISLLLQAIQQIMEQVPLAVEAIDQTFATAFERMSHIFNPGYPYRPGDPVPAACRIVKPAKGGKTWFAWSGDSWRPVHRVKNRGFIWSA